MNSSRTKRQLLALAQDLKNLRDVIRKERESNDVFWCSGKIDKSTLETLICELESAIPEDQAACDALVSRAVALIAQTAEAIKTELSTRLLKIGGGD